MQNSTSNNSRLNNNLVPLAIIGGLFFVFGFVTWLNGALIPFLQIACELNQSQALLVTLAFYISYTVMALPVTVVLKRFGYKNSLAIGLLVMAIGALLFAPAAIFRTYSIFLFALFILGTGLTILQTAANPYIVLIGPNETAAVRISMMGLLNKSAGIVAPLLFAFLILGDVQQFSNVEIESMAADQRSATLDDLSRRLIMPYLVMASMLVVLATYIKLSPLPDAVFESSGDESETIYSVLKHPGLVLGVVTLFFYMGAEVIAGDTIGLLGRELGVVNFASLTAYTMAFMMSGYVVGIITIPRFISQESALSISAILGIVLTVLIAQSDVSSTQLWTSLFSWTGAPTVPNVVLLVALFGFANALMWPAIWPMALKGLAPQQIGIGSALLIMGISGGAILPVVYGYLSDTTTDPRSAYWIMLPCYLFVLYYAILGHKLSTWSKNEESE